MSVRRPQLSLDELQQVKWLLGGALTLLALATIAYMEVEAWTLMLVAAGVTLASLIWPTLPARVPSVVHTLAFPAIAAFFAADLWVRAEILPAMVRLDILLLLYRNLTYRQRRDELQVIVLGFFLIIIAGVLTVSLTFALHLLVYTGCALALLLAITLSDAAAGAQRPPPPAPGTVPGWAAHARWAELFARLRTVADWRVAALGFVLFAGVVTVSALLFLAIPRFQLEGTLFLERLITKKAKSGFSDTIRFGDISEIQQDNSLALSVDVADHLQIPVSPYWRMLVLDEYLNGMFRMSTTMKREFGAERVQGAVRGDARLRRNDPAYWTFYLEAGVSRYLPLLGPFAELRFREQQNVRQAPGLALIALRDEPATMTAYRVDGFDPSGVLADPRLAERLRGGVPAETDDPALQLRTTVTSAEVLELTGMIETITAGRPVTAAEFADLAGAWLRERHAYSLSPDVPGGGGDPLVRWLRSRGRGHCELFAGGFVLLARTAGFPARVVTGFRGGSWNGYSNNFTIRNADAHAWAEIFDRERGAWLRADPLEPPRAATERTTEDVAGIAAARLDRSWAARWDSLRVFWYRRIVSFDQTAQRETLRAVKEVTQASGRQLREYLQEVVSRLKAWLTAPWDLRRALAWLAGLAVGWAVLMAWRRYGRGWWRRWRTHVGRGEDPVRQEASRWLAQLRRGPSLEATAATRASLERLRFGPRHTWPEPVGVFRDARQAVRTARRRRIIPNENGRPV